MRSVDVFFIVSIELKKSGEHLDAKQEKRVGFLNGQLEQRLPVFWVFERRRSVSLDFPYWYCSFSLDGE